jgi:hypothetical protein
MKLRFTLLLCSMLVVSLFFSCKKELVQPTTEAKEPYLYQEFIPFLMTGWVGQNSYDVDSTFDLDFDINLDGLPDFKFVIHEWKKQFYYSQDSIIYLPMQDVYAESYDFSSVQFSNDFISYQDTLADTNFYDQLKSEWYLIAKNYPGYYIHRDSTPSYVPLRIKLSNEWHHAWVKIHVTGASAYGLERAVLYVHESFLSLEANMPIKIGVVE